MARNAAHPGRTLIIFGLVVLAMYGGVAIGGEWTPKLGLDLQGGTRITLEASTTSGDDVTPAKLEEAAGIIDARVNGSGVSEAEVSTQGEQNIIVEIPGETRKDLVDTVTQTAQLRFRLVAGTGPGTPQPQPQTPGPTSSTSPSPGAPSGSPNGSPSESPNESPNESPSGSPSGPANESSGNGPQANPSESATPRRRALTSGLLQGDQPSPSNQPSNQPSNNGQQGGNQQGGNQQGGNQSPSPSLPPLTQPPPGGEGAPVDQPLAFSRNPGQRWLAEFNAFTCPPAGQASAPVDDASDKPLLTCDEEGVKYLLSAALIEGTQLNDASAGIPQNQFNWVVNLSFDSTARTTFADLTQQLAGTGEQFAIVLDGTVISAPTVTSPIPGGNAQIEGDFSQEQALTLANSLKYGALPLRFTAPVVTEEGPTLAADQLSAGVWAGVVGLSIVMIYCLIYYRGLGLVVLASLGIAAAITYAAVLAMSQAIGFTLTLPGIAGLIVAVGITADSFIVYFERIRDEMRDGKSMRVAVETGWVRARTTCLAADAVSLLAAIVLYIFAIGVVKGFAFALGISTVIDVLVFFLFTKPMVSWLAKFPFFNAGHKLSGLDAENLGVDRLPGVRPRAAGSRA